MKISPRTKQSSPDSSFKFDLKMKLSFLLLLFSLFQLQASDTYAQRTKVTLDLTNVTYGEIFEVIEKQTEFKFFYNINDVDTSIKTSIKVSKEKIDVILDRLFKNSDIIYKVNGKQVILTKKEKDLKSPVTKKQEQIKITGQVTDENALPLAGVTVQLKNSSQGVYSDFEGEFELVANNEEDILIFSFLGFQNQEIKIGEKRFFQVVLISSSTELDQVVIYSTGYQEIPKERVTGSFEVVDNELINRKPSTNILESLDGVTSGLLFDKRRSYKPRISDISIRGLSTLTSTIASPLVVLDDFPYEGDINNINPNDVESITILKDAAAASIWGARAGNGVIVITTKKGRYDKPLQISFNSNFTVVQKPDLMKLPQMNTSDFIDVEKFLFSNGFYNSTLTSTNYNYISPVVELLNQANTGQISQANADSQIDALRNVDVRDDFLKHVYRKAVTSQYAINFSGGSNQFNYIASAGYDETRANLVGNNNDRLTLRTNLFFKPIKNLELEVGTLFSQTNTNTQSSLLYSSRFLPYTQLADENGTPLVVGRDYATGFIDMAEADGLLDWKYRPLAELDASSNEVMAQNLLINLGANYRLSDVFNAEVKYRYEKSNTENTNLQKQESYYTRNFINLFTQPGSPIERPVPLGGILNRYNGSSSTYNLRGQINADKTWSEKHHLVSIVGAEVSENRIEANSNTIYGYDDNLLTFANVNNNIQYTPYIWRQVFPGIIPSGITLTSQIYRFTSVFANTSYTFDSRYTVSASARKDASNVFGVDSNQKGTPLWSLGAGWNISNETFYNLDLLPVLKLRGTYGYMGNTNKGLSALSIIRYSSAPDFYTNLPFANIMNPANPGLRWEKVGAMNLGLDFQFRNNRLTGSFEYYTKDARDLLSVTPIDPTSGFTFTTTNNADLTSKGFDLQLHSKNITGNFEWNTDFILNHNKDEVTRYTPVFEPTGSSVITSGYSITPIEGRPAYSLFSYRSAGLDPQTGDPRGYEEGEISSNYVNMIFFSTIDDLKFHGSAVPLYYGAFRNTFNWKNFTLSANITYKMGYFFRREGLSYSNLFSTNNPTGHKDFENRWMNPGDEVTTHVPSMKYPNDYYRDLFYGSSEALVSKGDHIRLQDITLGYTFNDSKYFKNLRLYSNLNNIGILWRANDEGIDPDFGSGYPAPFGFSLGFSANF